MTTKFPLAVRPATISNDRPFDGDLLQRDRVATRLTDYIDRLRIGAVLAIDAPWGEGKTWFGRNWANYLKSSPQNHKVVYIDAFANDYIEDPFLLLAGEITPALQADNLVQSKLQKSAVAVAKTLLPVGTKVLLNLAGRLALGSTDLSDEIRESAKAGIEGTSDVTTKWIEKKLENYSLEKKSLDQFRDDLANFANAQSKPVIIFIDELDRCRPSFAVQLIERIKHFFDVPNLVFVLLLNRAQLENAIRGVYGGETDASTYLSKFVHLFLRLPQASATVTAKHLLENFVVDVLSRYGLDERSKVGDEFTYELSTWANRFEMSLRDIERACAYFVMANVAKTALLSYLIALKLKRPTLYAKLSRGERSAHDDARQLVSTFIRVKDVDSMDWPDLYFQSIYDLHTLKMGLPPAQTPIFNEHAYRLFGYAGGDTDSLFARTFAKLDLPIDVS